MSTGFKVRAGQREFERGVRAHRLAGLLARRQYGKTTIAARIAMEKMMRTPGHTVVFGSVKLDLGREIVRKEADAMQKAIRTLATSASGKTLFDVVDAQGGKSVASVSADDFAELYEATRLEFRLYHDKTTYSRTKVVALTPAAVGETGDLILDEVGRVKNFREVWEAVRPIIASNPEFRCMLTTTPPPDDSHYSFELLAPPIGETFSPKPTGNWYRSELGVWVLRIDAWDAFADGVPLYDDDTGAAISPDEARKRDHDKDAWDRNYGVRFVLGGSAAVGLLQLDSAQRRGVNKCRCVVVDDDDDFRGGLDFLLEHLGSGNVAVGVDWATTEKATSNPTSLTVMEQEGANYIAPLTLVWKTADPDLAIARLRQVVVTINGRPGGKRCRRVAQDATSEKYHCANVRKALAALVPVEDVVGSETIELPGSEPMTRKAHLGNRLVGAFDDNQLTIAPERYLKTDMRLVRRDRGSFSTELGPNGEHGDTFDSHKLALHGLTSTAGNAIESTDGIIMGTTLAGRSFVPRHLPGPT
ncbi:MAG: hypothetical protein J0L84_00430 [Verrucomicrobia bacterium]|nr:hypothetical protein [Verrucomicrobiota bacterium]